MNNILGNVFNSWKTSVFGGVAGIPQVIEGIQKKDYLQVVYGAATFLALLMAKDGNVTGGTTQ